MVKHTGRDKVWCEAMRMAIEYKQFGEHPVSVKVLENILPSDAPSGRTIRDVLNTMADQGWLSKEKPQGHSWLPGPALRDVQLQDKPGAESPQVDAYHGFREPVYRS